MSLPQLRNMVLCAEAGAMILPAMPAFYQLPKTLDDLADFMAGKILAALGFDHDLYPPWTGQVGQSIVLGLGPWSLGRAWSLVGLRPSLVLVAGMLVSGSNLPRRADMGVYRFEDLRVWQRAKCQCDEVGKLFTRPSFRKASCRAK